MMSPDGTYDSVHSQCRWSVRSQYSGHPRSRCMPTIWSRLRAGKRTHDPLWRKPRNHQTSNSCLLAGLAHGSTAGAHACVGLCVPRGFKPWRKMPLTSEHFNYSQHDHIGAWPVFSLEIQHPNTFLDFLFVRCSLLTSNLLLLFFFFLN